jgi:hypothetical protein
MSSGSLSLIGSWFVAASTGAIAGWVLSLIRERWNRPRLQVAIDVGRGSVVETATSRGDHQTYARLFVHNRGRTLAQNCCVSIDHIKRTDPQGTNVVFATDVIDLKWSLQVNPSTVFHVPSRGYRLIDVGHTNVSAADFDENQQSPSNFWIDGAIIPNRLIPEFRMNATYEMHLRAYADNAASAEFSCRIKLGNTFRDLTLERCDDPRPRDQR